MDDILLSFIFLIVLVSLLKDNSNYHNLTKYFPTELISVSKTLTQNTAPLGSKHHPCGIQNIVAVGYEIFCDHWKYRKEFSDNKGENRSTSKLNFNAGPFSSLLFSEASKEIFRDNGCFLVRQGDYSLDPGGGGVSGPAWMVFWVKSRGTVLWKHLITRLV